MVHCTAANQQDTQCPSGCGCFDTVSWRGDHRGISDFATHLAKLLHLGLKAFATCEIARFPKFHGTALSCRPCGCRTLVAVHTVAGCQPWGSLVQPIASEPVWPPCAHLAAVGRILTCTRSRHFRAMLGNGKGHLTCPRWACTSRLSCSSATVCGGLGAPSGGKQQGGKGRSRRCARVRCAYTYATGPYYSTAGVRRRRKPLTARNTPQPTATQALPWPGLHSRWRPLRPLLPALLLLLLLPGVFAGGIGGGLLAACWAGSTELAGCPGEGWLNKTETR